MQFQTFGANRMRSGDMNLVEDSAMLSLKNYGNGIHVFDSGYLKPGLDAIHLIVDNGRVAFVDTGVSSSLPNARLALQTLGLDALAVDYVFLTHVHLDHAGGAGVMMRDFPRAKLVVHPRGARHMVDPTKLIAGAAAVYGDQYVREVYGEIAPIAPDRIIAAQDGEPVTLGERTLLCLDTPGHALHHLCVFDQKSGGAFTGDAFGLAYAALDVGERRFIIPATTPSQFDPEAMRASIERILALNPTALYLPHYGQAQNVPQLGADLLRRLDAIVTLARREYDEEAASTRLRQALTDYLFSEARAHGCPLDDAALKDILGMDIELNVQGLTHWLNTR
ncbi:MAG: MBL fold metallo-hydrolase [Zoogloeaceae bacterium]|jgi:glyoxylase-like metal-dependent hydrolase (beta-lactamase superfamily II)|nr:MBL fold metallo-hydrolase [Zoogloeaceae bacterium]